MRFLLFSFFLAAFSASSIFAQTIVTQRVFKTGAYQRGKTTLALKGYVPDGMQRDLAQGLTKFSIVNDKDGYLGIPTFTIESKNGKGFEFRSKDEKIKFKNKKGKFSWKGKESFNRFYLSDGTTWVPTTSAKFNGKGFWGGIEKSDFQQYPVTYVDTALGQEVAGIKVQLAQKGANLVYAEKDKRHSVKISINAKGLANVKYVCPEETFAPWFLTGLNIFTNNYRCTIEAIGPGGATAECVGPDTYKLVAAPEEGFIFRGFYVGDEVYTELEKTIVLTEDTHVKAIFGSHTLKVVTVGEGTADYVFTDSDTALITAVGTPASMFDTFEWNGLVSVDNPLNLGLVADTVVTANFVKAEYLVVDMTPGFTAAWPCYTTNAPPNLNDNLCRTKQIWLRKIKAGTYQMGSPDDEYGRGTREDLHLVTLTKPFYLAIFETTVYQYNMVLDGEGEEEGGTLPMTCISYEDLRGTDLGAAWPASGEVDQESFIGKFRQRTGRAFDLPTEAQWETGCRAGTTTALNSGKNLTGTQQCSNLDPLGYYYYNSSDIMPVGAKLPNA